MEGGRGGNATPERNRPGAATRGQQQPAVGHKSSKERPTRQGESSQHSAAAADGATGAGYPERGRERDRQKGKKGEARQANEGKCGRPAGQAVHAATNRGGRQQAPTPAWQPAGRAGSPCVCVLHGYYPQARNPDSSRNSCWIWNSLSSTDGSTMPPHPRADGPHHSSAETSLPRKPSVPESISSGGFEPATSRCVARSSSLFNVAAYDGIDAYPSA